MSNENKPYPSRLKNKKNRSNSILNMMIGLVFALILIVGAFIFLGQNDGNENAQEPESVQIAPDDEEQASEEDNNSEENTGQNEENSQEEPQEESAEDSAEEDEDSAESENESTEANSEEENQDKEQAEDEEQDKEGSVTRGGTITREKSEDPVVDETVINTSWEPVGTDQSGEHVSVYDEGHVDWKEKVAAISYATGLSENDMFIMRVENGGGPQKSVGVVQSKDKSEKYRVHMEWVDGEGWKPVKMDVLKTLEGAY